MVDGEALAVTIDGDDLHSGRVPEQRSWTSNLGFEVAAELRKVFRRGVRGLSILGQTEPIYRRGARGDAPGAGATPGRGPGPTRGWDPPLLQGWSLREPCWIGG